MRSGNSRRWNASLELMTWSRPAIFAPRCGAAPVAIRMVFGAHRLAGRGEAHGVGVLQHGAALHNRDLRPLQVGRIGRLEPRDLAVLVGDQRRPVEDRLRQRPAVAGGVLELVGKARGIDQKLLRHAAADHAGAADPIFLGHHDARAMARRDPRGPHAAGAGADDEKIDIVVSHTRPFAPAAL